MKKEALLSMATCCKLTPLKQSRGSTNIVGQLQKFRESNTFPGRISSPCYSDSFLHSLASIVPYGVKREEMAACPAVFNVHLFWH